MDDKEKMIDDIVAMLDNSVKKGDGHINVVIDEKSEGFKGSYKRLCRLFC